MLRRLLTRTADRIDLWLWPWAKWADKHGLPEMFWGPSEFWYANKSPRHLWALFREHWLDPQQECIDYIDGYCVGYYDTPSRFMLGVYKVRSWVDPRYWYYRAHAEGKSVGTIFAEEAAEKRPTEAYSSEPNPVLAVGGFTVGRHVKEIKATDLNFCADCYVPKQSDPLGRLPCPRHTLPDARSSALREPLTTEEKP